MTTRRFPALLILCVILPTACSQSAPGVGPTSVLSTRTTIETPDIGSTKVSNKDGATLVFVPAGEFIMGASYSDADALNSDWPEHRVKLSAYWIDRTEVTNAQWRKCVAAGGCPELTDKTSSTRPDYHTNPAYDNFPVVNVSWMFADAYCRWAGRRLPTEAEWEKAARNGDGRIYPWGNDAPNERRANFQGKDDTVAVGSYPWGASPYGVLDMAGNVYEWVHDWYLQGYYKNSPVDNPKGPDAGQARLMRGGAFGSGADAVKSSRRVWEGFYKEMNYVGFRCAARPDDLPN